MAAAYDYLVDDSYQMVFKNGDLGVGESDKQHIQDTVYANVGEGKENPQDGVGIQSYVNGTNIEQKLERKIKEQLASDGYDFTEPPKVSYKDTKELTVQSNAIRR